MKYNFSKFVLTFALFLSSVISYEILVASYSKANVDSNDDVYKSCLALAQSRMLKEYGDNISNSIVKIAIYSQIVNGINYKFLLGYKDPKTGSFKLVDTVVYTGPFSTFLTNPTPSVSSIMTLPSELLNTASNDTKTNRILTQLSTLLRSYGTTINKDYTFKNLKDIQTFNRYIYNENYYLVTASFGDSSNTAKDHILVVNELNGVFSVITHIN